MRDEIVHVQCGRCVGWLMERADSPAAVVIRDGGARRRFLWPYGCPSCQTVVFLEEDA